MQGAVDGVAGLAGGIAVRQIGALVPMPGNGVTQSLVDVGVATGVTVLAGMFRLPSRIGAAVSVGAMMTAYDRVIRRHFPEAGSLLGEDVTYGLTPGGGIPGAFGVGAYPGARARLAPGVGAYPQPVAPVDAEDFAL